MKEKDDKKKWQNIAKGNEEIPSVFNFVEKPLEAGLWTLYINKNSFGKDYLNAKEIENILINYLDIKIKAIQIKRAFARAGNKVISAREGYKIGYTGSEYIKSLKVHAPLGASKIFRDKRKAGDEYFIDSGRLKELKKMKIKKFDLSRLIKMCEEVNDNYSRENYISTIILVRAIIDHVPPIFGFRTFGEIVNNSTLAQSTKGSFRHLEESSRKIADAYLHIQARYKEVLPSKTQVNFSQDLDTLLSEVIRVLK